jgi:hypothetical protein
VGASTVSEEPAASIIRIFRTVRNELGVIDINFPSSGIYSDERVGATKARHVFITSGSGMALCFGDVYVFVTLRYPQLLWGILLSRRAEACHVTLY